MERGTYLVKHLAPLFVLWKCCAPTQLCFLQNWKHTSDWKVFKNQKQKNGHYFWRGVYFSKMVAIYTAQTAWRNFDAVLDTQAVPHLDNQPLQEQPCSRTMEPCTPHTVWHTANTKDLLWREAVGVLVSPSRSLTWMWSKTCSASSNDNQTMPTLSPVMCRCCALGFTGCEWHPSSINPPLIT